MLEVTGDTTPQHAAGQQLPILNGPWDI